MAWGTIVRRFASELLSGSGWAGRRKERERLAAELASAEAARRRLVEAIDLLPEGIVILDDEHRYVAWNRQYTSIYTTTADHIIAGRKLEDAVRAGLARGDYPEAIGREETWLAERLRRLKAPGPRHEQMLSDGRCIMIEDRLLSDGGLVSLRVDITEIKQREASFRLLFENNPLPMFVCDPETWAIREVNKAAIGHYGYCDDRLKGMTFKEIHCAVDSMAVAALRADNPAALLGRTFRHVRADGTIIEVELRSSTQPYHGQPSVIIAVIDVTDRKLSELKALHLLRHDQLTNLPNRQHLTERIEAALSAGEPVSLLFLDLDKFKTVNDMLGHGAGDELLTLVTRLLRSSMRACDTVARLGGDEFAILLHGIYSEKDLARLCECIVADIRQPLTVSGQSVEIGASLGVARSPHDTVDARELIRRADLAMYAAKAAGRTTFRFFDAAIEEAALARATLEAELRHAISHNELQVFYQPIVDIASGHVVSREALVRWQHPKRGLVPPIEFIPLAEETGLIVDIGTFVLRQSCIDAASWPDNARVSVNVSALELTNSRIVERVRSALEEAKLSPQRLQIEVTETAVINNEAATTALLCTLRELGVVIVMDDFGTGYSSLNFLRAAPFDKLKIDKSFVRDLNSERGLSIFSAILQMASALGLTVTAEGVETEAQRDMLRALNCSEGQGYLYGRPEPLAPQKRQAAA